MIELCAHRFSVVHVILWQPVSQQRLSREAHGRWLGQAAHPACRAWAAPHCGCGLSEHGRHLTCPVLMIRPVVGYVTRGRAPQRSPSPPELGDQRILLVTQPACLAVMSEVTLCPQCPCLVLVNDFIIESCPFTSSFVFMWVVKMRRIS